MSENDPTAGGPRKPRVALMGEFSAGKSTLSNLLMGARPLPEKVTATRLSPVWMSQGSDTPYRIDVDGTTEPITLDQLESVPVEETFAIRLFLDVDILSVCDLIDFPGISDPNMSSEVWERVLPEVDAVIWCTHATQAWRQSEAAVWENMPNAVREHSILLITRFDKLTTERDKTRVIKRVTRETEGQFSGIYPVSLLQAIAAGEDQDKWDASGAGPFVYRLIETIEKLTKIAECTERPLYNIPNGEPIPTRVLRSVAPRRVVRSRDSDAPKRERPQAEPEASQDNPPGPILRSS
ncbi:dynamin family protein [Cognatiyoonia sp. IB215182]|uniref:dynamin family protein n=1 Tax=Cognatiyoonia sp. IB215182 TaxID=3097353 RepID=UPI002A11E1ED|nr:dynamin family protein [Cognatiyoonia sp. IB215182]MDX8352632.1 GTPase [Cognatiyoonia sp. IB215182]